MTKECTMLGAPLKNMPWEEKPRGCMDVMWRYSGNQVTNWNPTKKIARVFNSEKM